MNREIIPVSIFSKGPFIDETIFAEANEASITLWQLPAQTQSQMNSYVIRTAGNEIIVIDGGTKGDASYLYKFIQKLGNHVDAWFISHPHLDHVDALRKILKSKEPIEIDVVYASLPDDQWLKKHEDSHAYKTQTKLKSALKGSNIEISDLVLGQTIEFKGATFEILGLCNQELTTMDVTNNQSAVWRVDAYEKSILFLGDLAEDGGEKLLNSPYGNRLDTDFVQMSHHGQQGVSEAFYKVVNPSYCLWPTPDWLWDNDSGKGHNSGPWKTLEVRSWMDKLNIENHYISKDGLIRIDLLLSPNYS